MLVNSSIPQSNILYLYTGVAVYSGVGDPEGSVNGYAGAGSIYTNLTSGAVFKKQTSFASNTGWVELAAGGGGSGTVTSVSAGDLSPLFTTTETNPTTTPTITFTQVSQTQNLVFASPNGSSGNPTFRALVAADIPNLPFSKITSGIVPLAQGGTGQDLSGITIGKVIIGVSTGVAGTTDLVDGSSGDVQVNGGAGRPDSSPTFNYDLAGNTLRLGASGVANGQLDFRSTAGNRIRISVNAPSTYDIILPNSVPVATTDVLTASGIAGTNITTSWTTPSGSGTVTSFSAGDLSPLFTTTETNPTTTPALSFAQVSQSQNLVFASPNGTSGNPVFRALVAADLPNTAVTPGSYTSANITVDAQGRLTAAANGSGGGSVANPTALIGLAAVNGVASSAIRSDGAPALDQAIAPTWTGIHTFGSGNARMTAPQVTTRIDDANGNNMLRFSPNSSATQSIAISNATAGGNCSLITNAPGVIATAQAGTNLNFAASNATAGNVTVGAAQGGGFLFQSGDAARLTSGTQRGGDWEFRRGASVGSTTIGGDCIFPTLTRYDDNPICFRLNAGTLLRQYGMGLTDGGATLSLHAPTTLSLCVGDSADGFSAGQVIMNNRTTVGWVSGTSNPFDFSPDAGLLRAKAGVVEFNDAAFPTPIGGTWRSTPTSPAQITSDQNNYNPGGTSYFIRLSTDASRQITGLSMSQVAGEIHEIWNVGAQDIVIVHQSASSTASNRFLCASAANYTITPDQGVRVWWDNTTQRWRAFQLN